MAGLTPPRPLAAADDRDAFDCGRASLNQWFRRNAWRNQQTGASRTSVLCDPLTDKIVAFVSLSAGQIDRAFLPKTAQRNQPDPLPIILLGQLAVDQTCQGFGLARSLILFAFVTSVRFSKEIGCFGILTHPLDEKLREFYGRFGFEALPGDPYHGMIVRIIDLEKFSF